jgi:hypothetical protein
MTPALQSMTKKPQRREDKEDLRPEYDFSKLKLVGRGIYAERYRSGTNLVLLNLMLEKLCLMMNRSMRLCE